MTIDMSQFHQVFFEESFEGLDVMESGLLSLDVGSADAESINTLFRAAHSIKGGSGTFGFTEVSDFTHVMETLLDEIRDGRRQVADGTVRALLESVDCLRDMLGRLKGAEPLDHARIAQTKAVLEAELAGAHSDDPNAGSGLPALSLPNDADATDLPGSAWAIAFSPHRHLLKTGNEPVRMFRELAGLGDLKVAVDLRGVPNFFDLDPEECYLSWKLTLTGDVGRDDVAEVFDWVENDCDLAIYPLLKHDSAAVVAEQRQGEAEAVKTIQAAPFQIIPNSAEPTAHEDAKPAAKSAGSIRVDIAKIDHLINMVGELVITQSMLSLVGERFEAGKLDQLRNGLTQLERHTRELQESVMNIRMLPVSFVFSRFPRLVHDLSTKLGKKIELKLIGENTEVDKTVVELLADPLVHLVRNSLDHGIEMPQVRLAAGKPETGTVTLQAYHRGGNIVIEVKDDGQGLDGAKLRAKAVEKGLIGADAALSERQLYDLIFLPGFSTADKLTDISGRGVGMDVVRRNIQALGGNIEIASELGKGSTFAIYLPLTLAILDGQSVAVGDEIYILPLGAIVESLNISEDRVNRVAGKGETFHLRSQYLPIIRLHRIFQVPGAKATKLTDGLLVVVESHGVRCGLFVDDLLGQQQVVIKSLEANYRRIDGVSGATILGDGSVALILDIPGLVALANQ
ncbi:chemotaxis protein CheA [Methylococcaceae bacterium WWC4]|nr:chemotaxis protein CheA [Methylococcaceae bacterium WWC4]